MRVVPFTVLLLLGCSGTVEGEGGPPPQMTAGAGGGAGFAGTPGSGGVVGSGGAAGAAGIGSPACPVGQNTCNGACVTLASDPSNCGVCGTVCPLGSVCQSGACQVLCASGQSLCGAECKTTVSDPANCGGCGLACPAGQVCSAGACAATCMFQPCDSAAGTQCADIMTNPAHCGGCGAACAAGQSCAGGFCTLNCPVGLTACSGQCVDTLTTASSCGSCGAVCPVGTPCIGGHCGCPAGQTLCSGSCVDLASNAQNCNGCGVACAVGLACEAGQCRTGCSAGLALCGTSCVDTAVTVAHCGGCDRPCPAAQTCVAGACQCPAGATLCGTRCVDTGSDGMHCGNCATVCPAGRTCSAGACACPNGLSACGAACVDVQTSGDHCGACGQPCMGGETCVAGSCRCPNGQTSCGGACVDTETSNAHCGMCNAACTTGQACLAGTCSGGGGVGADGCAGGLARNLAVSRIDAFQSVKVGIMTNGTEIAAAARNTDVIDGRETVFRVFVTPGSGWTAREISARVTLINGATADEFFAKKTVSGASSEADTASTFQVTVPPDKVHADSRYHVQLVECGTPGTGSATTPRFPTTGDTALGARLAGPLKVRIVPILANGMLPDTSMAGLEPYRKIMHSMYPVTGVELTVATQISTNYPIDWNGTLDQIRSKRQQDAPAADIYYYGLLKPTNTFQQFCGGGCTAGIGFVTSQNDVSRRVSLGIGFTGTQSPGTMAHEIGHNHGRNHAPCVPQGGSISGVDNSYPYSGGSIGLWGYNNDTKQLVNPSGITDIMGYCNNKWISDYTYDALVNRVALVNGNPEVYVNPDVLSRWRVLLLDDRGPRWGLPIGELSPPAGTPEIADIFGTLGTVIGQTVVYRTEVSDIDAASVMIPEPKADWYAVGIAGWQPHEFAAPVAVPAP